MCIYKYTFTHRHSLQMKEEILMTVRILGSVTGHVVIADIHNYLLPLPILYSLCLQQASQLVVAFTWLGDPDLHFCRILDIIRPAWIGLL